MFDMDESWTTLGEYHKSTASLQKKKRKEEKYDFNGSKAKIKWWRDQ